MNEAAAKHTSELSIVVLCYQAGETIRPFFHKLHALLQRSGIAWQLVLVGNYSSEQDATPAVLRELAQANPQRIVVVAKPKAGMMGWDVRSGLAAATGKYLAFIDGDGQMPVDDVLKIFQKITAERLDLVKTYRQTRQDGWIRRVVAWVYNAIFRLLFPGTGLRDVNSKPKIFTRETYERLRLASDDWFIDAESMIKARRLGLRVAEVPTMFLKNPYRRSYVKTGALFEFIMNLFVARLREFRYHAGDRRILWLVSVAAMVRAIFSYFALRLLGAAGWLASAAWVQTYFWQLANNLLHEHAFTLSQTAPYVPNTFHVPLYPAFVALLLAFSPAVTWLIAAHIALGVLVVYLVWRTACEAFGERVGLLAGWLFALEPFAIFSSGVIYSEMLFLAFFLPAVLLFIRFVKYGRLASASWSGFFLGLAILTRAVAQFSIVLFAAGLLVVELRRGKRWRGLYAPALCAATMLAVLIPWLMRNEAAYHTPQLSFLGGYTFYLYNVSDFLAAQQPGYGGLQARDAERNDLRRQFQAEIADPAVSRIDEDVSALLPHQADFYKAGLKIIAADPVGYLRYQTVFTLASIFSDGYRDILSAYGVHDYSSVHFLSLLAKPSNLRAAATEQGSLFWNALLFGAEAFWLAVVGVIVLGFFKLLLWRNWHAVGIFVFFGLLILYFNTAAGSLSSGRYRFVSVPLLLILFAHACFEIFKIIQPPRHD